MNYLEEILKLEFTKENQSMITIMIGNVAYCYRKEESVFEILNATMKDIELHGINYYHYLVIQQCEELLSLAVLN